MARTFFNFIAAAAAPGRRSFKQFDQFARRLLNGSIPLESSASFFLVLSLFENLFELSNQPLIELKYPSDGLLQGFAGQRINVQFALVGLC
jgi:hypothetical protein